MVQSIDYLKETPSQTAGPDVHIGCTPNFVGISGMFAADLGSGPLVNDLTRGARHQHRSADADIFFRRRAGQFGDPILARIEHRERVSTLIGKLDGNTVTFNIHLQAA